MLAVEIPCKIKNNKFIVYILTDISAFLSLNPFLILDFLYLKIVLNKIHLHILVSGFASAKLELLFVSLFNFMSYLKNTTDKTTSFGYWIYIAAKIWVSFILYEC